MFNNRKISMVQLIYLIALILIPALVHAKVIEVGPTRKYKTPSEASMITENAYNE